MTHLIRTGIEVLASLCAFASLAYYSLCIFSALKFLKRKAAGEGARSTQEAPPVSILKPLKGIDPEMYESLRSHCLQNYSEYELIFGVSDLRDPAIALVTRLKVEFPNTTIRIVHCTEPLGTNIKLSNLAQMLALARYENIVMNDADIRVGPNYLRSVVPPLADEKIGMVTCLYRGIAAPTLSSWLESVGISTDFCAGVLAAQQLEGGIAFGLGSTLAFRRSDLARIGGFESLVNHLADDYELGRRIAGLGLRVELSQEVVETFLPPYTFRQYIAHQLRWARGVRDSRRWGYVGLIFTFGMPWSLLALTVSAGATWAWVALALTLALRFTMAGIVAGKVLRQKRLTRVLALVPLRDLIAFAIWLASFAGNRVTWRGDSFVLRHGVLIKQR